MIEDGISSATAAIEIAASRGMTDMEASATALRSRLWLMNNDSSAALGVYRGEVVLEDAGWGCPAECSVGSVVIVEMHEPGVGAGPLGF